MKIADFLEREDLGGWIPGSAIQRLLGWSRERWRLWVDNKLDLRYDRKLLQTSYLYRRAAIERMLPILLRHKLAEDFGRGRRALMDYSHLDLKCPRCEGFAMYEPEARRQGRAAKVVAKEKEDSVSATPDAWPWCCVDGHHGG